MSFRNLIIDDLYPQCEYQCITKHAALDPCSHIKTITATVWVDLDDKQGRVITHPTQDLVQAAAARFYYVDMGGCNPCDILDSLGQLAPYIALYDKDGFFSVDTGDDFFGESLFIIDRIEILPPFRGIGLSKYLIEDACNVFCSGFEILALKPFPLQKEYRKEFTDWDSLMNINEMPPTCNGLIKHYTQMGFELHHDIMYKAYMK